MFFVYYTLVCFKEEVYSQNQIKEFTSIESGQFMKGHSGNTYMLCSCWLAACSRSYPSLGAKLSGLAHTRWKSVFCFNALEVVGFQAGSSLAPDGHPVLASSSLPASAIPRVLLYL